MAPPYPGSCLCGRVRFQLIADPLTFYVCHCTDCQRRTGGAALLVMWVGRFDLQILAGQPSLQVFDLGNGRQRRSRLCPHCDTRLWAKPIDKPDIAILRPGTLQNQGEFEPIAHRFPAQPCTEPSLVSPKGLSAVSVHGWASTCTGRLSELANCLGRIACENDRGCHRSESG